MQTTILISLVFLLLMLITVALIAPGIIRRKVNGALNASPGYEGNVEWVRLRLWAGKIILDQIRLATNPQSETRLSIHVPKTVIAFEWRKLFRKSFYLNVEISAPAVTIIGSSSQSSGKVSAENTHNLFQAITALPPFNVCVKVVDGNIRYAFPRKGEMLTIEASWIDIAVKNFNNIPGESPDSKIELTGKLYGGTLSADATLTPLAPTLTVDLNVQMKNIALTEMNELLRAYARVDVNAGTLEMFSELAVANRRFKGYVKPIFSNLTFFGEDDKHDKLTNKIWERIVATTIHVLKNDRNNQIATTVPIEGELTDPDIHFGAALAGIFVNAFIKALEPSLDDVVNVKSMWSKVKNKAKDLKTRFSPGSGQY